MKVQVAKVRLWGRDIGAVSQETWGAPASFQFTKTFARSGIEVSPLVMPLSDEVYRFPQLRVDSFHRLPGLLADSVPDRFGNALIDAWLARDGRDGTSFSAVERLCYTGSRGMGALEFSPVDGPKTRMSVAVDVNELADLAAEVLANRQVFSANLADQHRAKAMRDILSVGTSAGGARAKALIAWNPDTNEVRSGQVPAGAGFDYWLLKFDGVAAVGTGQNFGQSAGYGATEFAYSLMARSAGVIMSPCRLMEEGGRRHFMTQRFDRLPGGDKMHMQTLGALAHYDFNHGGGHAYEQALQVIRKLKLPTAAIEEQFRRMVFNVVARNQDDHAKNISFLMNKAGRWSLAPAYDLTYSYNPTGPHTAHHQMTINGKRDDFTRADFRACADGASMMRGRADAITDEVMAAVRDWPRWATEAQVDPRKAQTIQDVHRLDL